ncbi:MAG TPA: hypothetical protein VF157_04625 [Chloroflexota bacterium]
MTLAHPQLLERRGDYGFDASTQGLIPLGAGRIIGAGLALMLARRSKGLHHVARHPAD